MGHKQEAKLSKGQKQFGREHAETIVAFLRADELETVQAAAIRAGVSPNLVKQGLYRFRHGKASEAEAELYAMIELAVEDQCKKILRKGEELSDLGKSTAWQQWRAETKLPSVYGRKQALEVSGPEGTPLRYETMSPAELRAEAEKLLGGVPALVLEAPKEEDPDV